MISEARVEEVVQQYDEDKRDGVRAVLYKGEAEKLQRKIDKLVNACNRGWEERSKMKGIYHRVCRESDARRGALRDASSKINALHSVIKALMDAHGQHEYARGRDSGRDE